eukprot:6095679-Amphidinium_carterae.1
MPNAPYRAKARAPCSEAVMIGPGQETSTLEAEWRSWKESEVHWELLVEEGRQKIISWELI